MDFSEMNPVFLLIIPAALEWALTAFWFEPYWAICFPIAVLNRDFSSLQHSAEAPDWPPDVWVEEKNRYLIRAVSEGKALVRESYRGKGGVGGTLFFVAELDRVFLSHSVSLRVKLRWYPIVLVGFIAYFSIPISMLVLVFLLLFALPQVRSIQRVIDNLDFAQTELS